MLQNVIIGQYIPVESLLHRFDPRAKILSVFVFIFIIFLVNNWTGSAVIVSFTLFLAILSRIPFRFLYRGLKPILWLVLFTLLLHVFITKEGELWLSLGPITIYEGGVSQGLFLSIRLLSLVMLTSLLTLTTSPIDLTDGLETLLSPFKKVGLPAHELALMMSIALRFIPTFMQETEKIMKAQMARG